MFNERARRYFQFEVAVEGVAVSILAKKEITELLGPDSMPHDYFGDPPPGSKWTYNQRLFFFANAADAVHFKLRFG